MILQSAMVWHRELIFQGLYGSSVLQQHMDPVALCNQVDGHEVLQHAPMLQTTETHVRNQSAIQGAGQDSSETEDEKNRRYQ